MHSYIISLVAVLSLNAHATVDGQALPLPGTSEAPVVKDPRLERFCAEILANPDAAGKSLRGSDDVVPLFKSVQRRIDDIEANMSHAAFKRERYEREKAARRPIITPVAEATADAVASATDAVKDAAADAADKGFFGKTLDQIGDKAGRVKKQVVDLKDSAIEKGKRTKDKTVDKAFEARERASAFIARRNVRAVAKDAVRADKTLSLNIVDKNNPEHDLARAAAINQAATLGYLRQRLSEISSGLGVSQTDFVVAAHQTGPEAIRSYFQNIVNGSRAAEATNTAEETKVNLEQSVDQANQAEVERAERIGWRQRFVERVTSAFGTAKTSAPSQYAARNSKWLTSIGLGAGVFAASHFTGQTEAATWIATVAAGSLPFIVFNKKVQDFATKTFFTVKMFVQDQILNRAPVRRATAWTTERAGRAAAFTRSQYQNASAWTQARAGQVKGWSTGTFDSMNEWLRVRNETAFIRATEQIKTFEAINEQLTEKPLAGRLIYNSFVVNLPLGAERNFNPMDPQQIRDLVEQGLRDAKAGKRGRVQPMRIEILVFRGRKVPEMIVLASKVAKDKFVPDDVQIETSAEAL